MHGKRKSRGKRARVLREEFVAAHNQTPEEYLAFWRPRKHLPEAHEAEAIQAYYLALLLERK